MFQWLSREDKIRYTKMRINTLELPRPCCGRFAQTVRYQEWLENCQNCSLKGILFVLVVSLLMWQTWSPAAASGSSPSFPVPGLKLQENKQSPQDQDYYGKLESTAIQVNFLPCNREEGYTIKEGKTIQENDVSLKSPLSCHKQEFTFGSLLKLFTWSALYSTTLL